MRMALQFSDSYEPPPLNPATGLPMYAGLIDVTENVYGTSSKK